MYIGYERYCKKYRNVEFVVVNISIRCTRKGILIINFYLCKWSFSEAGTAVWRIDRWQWEYRKGGYFFSWYVRIGFTVEVVESAFLCYLVKVTFIDFPAMPCYVYGNRSFFSLVAIHLTTSKLYIHSLIYIGIRVQERKYSCYD